MIGTAEWISRAHNVSKDFLYIIKLKLHVRKAKENVRILCCCVITFWDKISDFNL